jgi:diguanylate cyclase (GGDEF)-like protein
MRRAIGVADFNLFLQEQPHLRKKVREKGVSVRQPAKFFQSLAQAVFGTLPRQQLHSLFLSRNHPPLVARRRAAAIISRVRVVSGLFAILTPLWIIVDLFVFDWPVTVLLVIGRILTTFSFALLAVSCRNSSRMPDAYRALGFMFSIPTLFFVFSHPTLSHFNLNGMAAAISAGYAFLPFVMVAGLSVFPLTAIEAAVFALPVLAAEAAVALLQLDMLNWASHLGAFWLLFLIATVAALAGMSQLSYMMSLVRQASHDGLTACFSRSSTEEMLEIQFHLAARRDAPLSVVFIDLDNFKQVNDRFGHDAGDRVLKTAADRLRANLRTGDILGRWGGEEFALILPDCGGDTASTAIARLRERGLGDRPDGTPLTASYGIAERVADNAADWQALIEFADQRMYEAKLKGKDCCIGCSEREPRMPAAETGTNRVCP